MHHQVNVGDVGPVWLRLSIAPGKCRPRRWALRRVLGCQL